MDKLKLETMKALMEALPSLAQSGAKRIKYGEFEVEFHEPSSPPQQLATAATTVDLIPVRVDPQPAVEVPEEPEEDDEEPGDPLFHHLPPAQRPSIS